MRKEGRGAEQEILLFLCFTVEKPSVQKEKEGAGGV